MFSNDRDELRKIFFEAWRKHQSQLPVEPLEAQIIDIILMHPEYHAVLNHPEKSIDASGENPFLHLSLHLAVLEQVNTNRPAGIQAIYQQLCVKVNSRLAAEHLMMECLANALWQAQQSGKMPDEENYLACLRSL